VALQQRVKSIEEMDSEARQKVMNDATKLVTEGDGDVSKRFALMLVTGLSRAFQNAGDGQRSIEVFDRFIGARKATEDDDIKQWVDRDGNFASLATRGEELRTLLSEQFPATRDAQDATVDDPAEEPAEDAGNVETDQ
jgi:hypothetical protein